LLEKAGVFAIVLEGIPSALGKKITKAVKIPTIGIGAGPACDGQILVLDDVLGFSEGPSPKFVARYAEVRPIMIKALSRFSSDVRGRRFPTERESYR
jgi:3-methyl-2-oxobutanoate hydroxymethyltransferase